MASSVSSQNLEKYIEGIAESLANTDPDTNRLSSRTGVGGDSETFISPGETISALRRAVEVSDILDARANKANFFTPIKVTRN